MTQVDPLWKFPLKMTEGGLHLYIMEARINADAAAMSLRELQREFASGDDIDIRRFIFSAQSILSAGAAISRILFPSPGSSTDPKRPARVARGKRLRQELGVPEDSPLKQRRLRNTIEHLDERLDDIVPEALARGDHFAMNVILGSVDAIVARPPSVVRMIRSYVIPLDTLRVLDDELELGPYLTLIDDLLNKCTAWEAAFKIRWESVS